MVRALFFFFLPASAPGLSCLLREPNRIVAFAPALGPSKKPGRPGPNRWRSALGACDGAGGSSGWWPAGVENSPANGPAKNRRGAGWGSFRRSTISFFTGRPGWMFDKPRLRVLSSNCLLVFQPGFFCRRLCPFQQHLFQQSLSHATDYSGAKPALGANRRRRFGDICPLLCRVISSCLSWSPRCFNLAAIATRSGAASDCRLPA